LTGAITFWRIATDMPEYTADDITGKGAETSGGRWNRPGRPVLYTAGSIALACLESAVHIASGGLPFNRYLVEVTLPGDAWKARLEMDAASLPVGWDALPKGRVSLDIGDHWLAALASPVLVVPSVIVPEEKNVAINPLHPLTQGMTAKKIRKWLYDPRLLGRRFE
jgi:RES domain-containing protein